MSDTDLLTIHTDGAARGNPGPAAFAFVIARSGDTVAEEHGLLGTATNNVAEYTALVKALERASRLGARKLVVNSDSELMVKQMRGEYKVKHEGLRPLYEAAQGLTAQFDQVKFHHVRRNQNRRADALCNEALDGAQQAEPNLSGKTAAPASVPSKHGPPKKTALPAQAREDILDCLRSVACVWSAGDPNNPRAEDVWDQLWFILEDAGVIKQAKSQP